MDASLPANQPGSAASLAADITTTLPAQQLYHNDLLLVALNDKLRLNNLVIIGGIVGLVIIVHTQWN